MTAPVLDVVIPVYNEQATLEACVRRLHAHLVATFPYPFRITVADNASTDRTWEVATGLAAELPGVVARHIAAKGRGLALQLAWSQSDAAILAYMDVDLSTDLDALWPLVAPLLSGHSDLAIGSRLRHGSRVVRGLKREVISRCYNLLLRASLGARFSDAQCGFKAIRADVAHEVLPLVQNTSWFFDTELLVVAEHCGLRIHEVPVDWYDDPDSRVDVVGTASDDLRGMWRLRRSLSRGELPTGQIASTIGRGQPREAVGAQALLFVWFGVLCGLLQLGLFWVLRQTGLGQQAANAVALVSSTVVNTSLNRRFTFGVRGREGSGRHQVQGLAIVGLTLATTSGALALLSRFAPTAPHLVEVVAVGFATVVATVVKFVVMRRWMFRKPEGTDAHATASVADSLEVGTKLAPPNADR